MRGEQLSHRLRLASGDRGSSGFGKQPVGYPNSLKAEMTGLSRRQESVGMTNFVIGKRRRQFDLAETDAGRVEDAGMSLKRLCFQDIRDSAHGVPPSIGARVTGQS
jgi:hypothetical protein